MVSKLILSFFSLNEYVLIMCLIQWYLFLSCNLKLTSAITAVRIGNRAVKIKSAISELIATHRGLWDVAPRFFRVAIVIQIKYY